MELTEQQLDFLDSIIENKHSTVVLGKAGVGKSYAVRALLTRATELALQYAVLAPTGIAAINVGGVTVHRFLNILRNLGAPLALDFIVIDECSMVRADLLDALDKGLRSARGLDNAHLPFGGVPLALVGDVRQLPPVVTDQDQRALARYKSCYFFSSAVFGQIDWNIIQLTHIFRTKDEQLIEILNAMREGDPETLKDYVSYLNDNNQGKAIGTVLTTNNYKATNINRAKLSKLPGAAKSYIAMVMGEYLAKDYPTEREIILKVGARVMCIKNIYEDVEETPGEKLLKVCNGDIGIVTELRDDAVVVKVNRTGEEVIMDVGSGKWEKKDLVPSYIEKDGITVEVLESQVIGTFLQLPLRLAWAITIHKSQGMSLSELTIDLTSDFFAPGQAYVAFSRATSLEGLRLVGYLKASGVMSCPIVTDFLNHGLESKFIGKPGDSKDIFDDDDIEF